jgi:hypothetical protein
MTQEENLADSQDDVEHEAQRKGRQPSLEDEEEDIDITFHQCIMQLRHLKVEPIAGEVVDPTCIFDIQYYKYFINTYCSFEHMILIIVF